MRSAEGLPARLTIEPFDRTRHDRAAFSCGVDRIDNFLKITASRHVADDNGKIYVAVESGAAGVIGFYALSPHSIDVSSLPEDDRKRMPRLPTLSAIYLSMVGVDRSMQGHGVGSFLMADALRRSVAAADIIGGRFMVLDAINEDAARMYRRLGFVDLPSQSGRMLLSMTVIRKAVAKANAGIRATVP